MRIAGLYDLDHFGHRRRHVTIVGNAWRSFPFGTENSPNEKHLEMKQLPSKTGIMLTARTVTRAEVRHTNAHWTRSSPGYRLARSTQKRKSPFLTGDMIMAARKAASESTAIAGKPDKRRRRQPIVAPPGESGPCRVRPEEGASHFPPARARCAAAYQDDGTTGTGVMLSSLPARGPVSTSIRTWTR